MTVFAWQGWEFDPAEWRLTDPSGGVVSLPNKSLALLALLIERAPGLVSKEEILSTVWRDSVVEEGNIAFHVAALRKTLGRAGEQSCIETVRGRGYRFVVPVTRRSPLVEASTPAPSEFPATADQVTESAPPQARRRVVYAVPVVVLAAAAGILGWVAFGAPARGIREIAVLPVMAAGEGAPIAGAADAMAADLEQLPSITARTVTPAAPSETPSDTGRRVGADTVLRTTVDRSTTPWRVTADLTRARDGVRIWNWVFEVPAESAGVPNVIAAHVAAGLGSHLGATTAPRSTGSEEALTLTLRGRESWRLRTPPSVQQAIRFYERAISIDPSFARAYAGLADCYNLTMSGLPVAVRAVNAKANAERALLLDPGSAEAHTSLAFSLYKFEWKWAEAEAAFRRAIAADPSYALAHHWYGEMLGLLGRFDEAIAELRQAHALEPASLAILDDLAGPLMFSGRVEDARAVVEAAAAINPAYHGVPKRMAEILALEGRERESLEEAWRAGVIRGAPLESIEELRAAYRTGGMPAVLRVEIARLEAGGEGRFAVPAQASFLASKYAQLRDREKTLRWINVAIDRREDIVLHLPTYSEYDWLRDDPAFTRALARAGLKPLPR